MKAKELYEISNKLDFKGNNSPYGILRILNQYDARITEYDIGFDGNEFLTLKEVHHYDIEGLGKYSWCLDTLWFKDEPIAVIQRAGRYGESHEEIYVTNKELMDEAMNYLYDINNTNYANIVNPMVIREDIDLPSLTDFYDYKLDYFYAEDIEIIYNVGDTIEIETADKINYYYGIINEDEGKSKRKVKIIEVNTTNPSFTYKFYELDRKREKMYSNSGVVDNYDNDVDEGYRILGWLTSDSYHIK